ncbi:MAG TPA: hypothetical protein VNY51_03010 [Candidatus Dormibacteraeota bacterium]|nr:hypothetical protein [Candidatus Dormibacteraeota bacterium]
MEHSRTTQRAANYSRALFEQVRKIANLSNTILKLNLKGDEATATVFQHFLRTQTKAGALRNIDTSVIQDETWARTPQGWELRRVSHIHARKWYVDGKRSIRTNHTMPKRRRTTRPLTLTRERPHPLTGLIRTTPSCYPVALPRNCPEQAIALGTPVDE